MNNFRNFSLREVSFDEGINIIIAKNGSWKTNILEALSLPSAPLVESQVEYLIAKWENNVFVEIVWSSNRICYSYDREQNKKQYIIGSKTTSKSKVKEYYPHVISFHPMLMNLLYLSPSERRNFLDEILSMTFPEYKKEIQNYKKLISSRNKVLKNISDGKSEVSELDFWDAKYISSCESIYEYRQKIISYFIEHIDSLKKYFFGKIETIKFLYSTKIDIQHAAAEIQSYIVKNRNKEILLRKTLRWPHLDDFDIFIDDIPLIHYASRWEVKSILIWMKLLERGFIKKYAHKKEIIYLIDDLMSELDMEHRNLLIEHLQGHQAIVTSIQDIEITWNKIFI